MAKLKKPEENAKVILKIFVDDFKCKPGDSLLFGNLQAQWFEGDNNPDDFMPSLELCVENKWIKKMPKGRSYQLTKLGFDKA